MPKSAPMIIIEEKAGNQYPSLEATQRAALSSIASDIAETMRRLLADGWLVNDNGRIIPNPERMQRK